MELKADASVMPESSVSTSPGRRFFHLLPLEAAGIRKAEQMFDGIEFLQVGGDGLKAQNGDGIWGGTFGTAGPGFGANGGSAAQDEAVEAASVDLLADLLQVTEGHGVTGLGLGYLVLQGRHLGFVFLWGGRKKGGGGLKWGGRDGGWVRLGWVGFIQWDGVKNGQFGDILTLGLVEVGLG